MRRFLPDPYIVAILCTVILASLLPARGPAVAPIAAATKLAIALLFFLHGAKLSRESVLAGATHWRLHLLVMLSTFAMFPLLGLALKPIFGLTGLFIGASLAGVALLPTARSLSKDFGQTFRETWIRPIGSELPFILVSGIALGLAWKSHLLGCAIAAIGLTSALVIYRIWRLGYRS